MRLLFIAALAFLAWLAYQRLKKDDVNWKAIGLGAGAVVIFLLVITGKAPALFALLAAAMAAATRVASFGLNNYSLFEQLYRKIKGEPMNEQASQQARPPRDSKMTRGEALSILGLDESATPEDIKKAHRKLISALHPDKGGTPELAARVNKARDTLLG